MPQIASASFQTWNLAEAELRKAERAMFGMAAEAAAAGSMQEQQILVGELRNRARSALYAMLRESQRVAGQSHHKNVL